MEIELKACFSMISLSAQFAVCSTHLAWSVEKDVNLINLHQSNLNGKNMTIMLEGHHRNISCLKFVWMDQKLSLVSASSDYVIVWHINEVESSYQFGSPVRGHVLCSVLHAPHYIGHNPNLSLLCCISDWGVNVINVTCPKNDKIVANHEVNSLSCGEFIDDHNIVVTSYEGHTLLLNFDNYDAVPTNIQNLNCSLISLAGCVDINEFTVGSSVAKITWFAFHDREVRFKPVMTLDLDEKLTHAYEQWKRTGSGDESRGHVIALKFIKTAREDLNGSNRCLLCATERALFTICCNNQDVDLAPYPQQRVGAPLVGQAQFSEIDSRGKVLCAATCLLEPSLLLFWVTLPRCNGAPLNLSLVPSLVLSPHSPLKSECKLLSPPKSTGNRPLTFRSKIKSSGYATAPRMTMFKPTTNVPRKKRPRPQPRSVDVACESPVPRGEIWINDVVSDRVKVVSGDRPISFLAVEGRSQRVACVVGPSVFVGNLPACDFIKKSRVISGHREAVSGCSWSHEKNLLMTYTKTGCVNIWNPPYTNDALMTFQAECRLKARNELIQAQFYYLDKFILVGIGNKIRLHKYILKEKIEDDVKRYLCKSREKVVEEWCTSSQGWVSLSAPNSFYSYIVLACASDRSISVLDTNANCEVHKFNDAHPRPAHTIQLATPNSNSSSDLFMTSSPADGFKIWDLREQKCVRKLTLHPCMSKCHVTMSKCGRYVVTSTDSKSVWIYDVRKWFPLQEINRKTKTTSLTFADNAQQLLLGDDSSSLEIFCSI